MYYVGICFAIVFSVTGCVRVEYLEYQGVQEWPTGSAFVGSVEDVEVEVYEGLPQRPYEVIGLVDVYDDDPFTDSKARKEIMEFVDAEEADALIWLSDRVVASGSLIMGRTTKGPASVDTGRSSQPEMTVTNVNQYVATSRRKVLRSTLLLIRWKQAG